MFSNKIYIDWFVFLLMTHLFCFIVTMTISRIANNYKSFAISGIKRNLGIPKKKSSSQINYIILYLTNCTILGSCIFLAYWLQSNGFGNLYLSPIVSLSNFLVILLQVLLILFILDTQHYFVHRLMHAIPFLYKKIHITHHRDYHINAWSSFSMNPLDFFISITLPATLITFFEFHIYSYFIAILMGFFSDILFHCGHEITRNISVTPNSWVLNLDYQRKNIARLFTNITHHDLHHQYCSKNYSKYFTFWDYYFNTTSHDADDIYFSSIKNKN